MGKPSGGGPSLAEYAEANPPRRSGGCSVCALAERAEIDAFYRKHGPAHVVVYRWLQEKGVAVTKPKLTYHHAAGHHEYRA